MFSHVKDESSDFLPNLTNAFLKLDPTKPLTTREFVDACARVEPIFDHIGTVFKIAKHEFETKRETLEKIADKYVLLKDIVDAGKLDKTITIKNSPARNLHRLVHTLAFISAIFKHLQLGESLKDAVSGAYDETLGKLHTWMVRTGIKAGMLGLPSRDAFFKSIGETPDSAREHADGFTSAANAIVAAVEGLYDGVEMPGSDFTVSSLWK